VYHYIVIHDDTNDTNADDDEDDDEDDAEVASGHFIEWTVDIGQVQALAAGMKKLEHYLQ